MSAWAVGGQKRPESRLGGGSSVCLLCRSHDGRAPRQIRRGTFPPQGGGGKRQEASPARGAKARRKVFGMRT